MLQEIPVLQGEYLAQGENSEYLGKTFENRNGNLLVSFKEGILV